MKVSHGLIVVGLYLIFTIVAGSGGQSMAAPAPSGKITLYTSVPQDIVDRLQTDYKSKFPAVTLEVFRAGSSEVEAKMAAEKGWLRLSFLFLNDVPISSQFWIICNKTGFILKTVYDQEYKKFSPGKILTAEMIKYAIDIDKIETLDYVHGDEPYKEDWTPKRRERKGIRIYNNTLKGRYLNLLDNKILPIVNKNKQLKKAKQIIANRLR